MSDLDAALDELDYIDIAALLSDKASYILNYLYGLQVKNSAFISSTGATFASAAAKVDMLNSTQIGDTIYAFILQNGISKNSKKLLARYN